MKDSGRTGRPGNRKGTPGTLHIRMPKKLTVQGANKIKKVSYK